METRRRERGARENIVHTAVTSRHGRWASSITGQLNLSPLIPICWASSATLYTSCFPLFPSLSLFHSLDLLPLFPSVKISLSQEDGTRVKHPGMLETEPPHNTQWRIHVQTLFTRVIVYSLAHSSILRKRDNYRFCSRQQRKELIIFMQLSYNTKTAWLQITPRKSYVHNSRTHATIKLHERGGTQPVNYARLIRAHCKHRATLINIIKLLPTMVGRIRWFPDGEVRKSLTITASRRHLGLVSIRLRCETVNVDRCRNTYVGV